MINNKVIPTPLLNEFTKANLTIFHPLAPNVMKTKLPQKWKCECQEILWDGGSKGL